MKFSLKICRKAIHIAFLILASSSWALYVANRKQIGFSTVDGNVEFVHSQNSCILMTQESA